MKLDSCLRAAVALISVLLSASAMAQARLASLELAFTQPTGTALATDPIPVYVSLTNTDPTRAFVVNDYEPLSGLNPADVPTTMLVSDWPEDTYHVESIAYFSSITLYTTRSCSGTGTFTDGCRDGAYHLQLADNPFPQRYELAPGATHTYLFATLVPVGGHATPGRYEFYDSSVGISFIGYSINGDLYMGFQTAASTCSASSAAYCAANGLSYFSRTVTAAVPEPASVLLLVTGVLALIGRARGRRTGSPTAAAANAAQSGRLNAGTGGTAMRGPL
jgi:hypothetical protein